MHFFARAVIVVSGCFVCIGAAQTNESVRTIPYAPNRPLSERLLPDDDVVVVTMRADEVVTPRRPTARAMASALLRDYTAIVLRLDRSEGLLVDNGRWIASRLTGEVVERLNTVKTTGTAALKAGTGVSVAMHGGSLRLGRVLLKTDQHVELEAGQTYVVFLGEGDEWQHLPLVMHGPLIVEPSGRLRDASQAKSELNGMTLESLKRIARSR